MGFNSGFKGLRAISLTNHKIGQVNKYTHAWGKKDAEFKNTNYKAPPPNSVRAPSGPGPPHCRSFTITLHSVRLLWTGDQPDAETST